MDPLTQLGGWGISRRAVLQGMAATWAAVTGGFTLNGRYQTAWAREQATSSPSETQPATLRVLGIGGSLRAGSYNRGLLRAAQELTPAPHTLEIADLSALPLYNPDVEAQGFPPAVAGLRTAAAIADALLFATPEYYRSIPGALKNAIDWLGRPPNSPLARKPYAVLGATTADLGTVRAQLQLREILLSFDLPVVQRPEVFISNADGKFDEQGSLLDPASRQAVQDLVAALLVLTEQLQQSWPPARA
jgi:chromate reductase, NAD(P)H dehydrogenase (quinone)